MENKHLKKQILLALMPVVALCVIVFFTTLPKSVSTSNYDNELGSSMQSEYTTEDPKSEPIYISIFKFIVNCNPFQKETQL